MRSNRYTFRFRTTLLGLLLGLVVVAVSLVGFGSYHNARIAADHLAAQVLDQTSARIGDRIVWLLQTASIQGELTRKLLLNPDIPPHKIPTAADFPIVNLEALCQFLGSIRVGRAGFAVVVEELKSGHLQLIAHPDVNMLIKQVGRDHWLIPTDEIKEPRVRALMQHLDASRTAGKDADAGRRPWREWIHDVSDAPASGTPPRRERLSFQVGDGRFLGTCYTLGGDDLPDWLICTVVPEAEIMGVVWRSHQLTFAVGALALIAALLVSVRVSAQVARPLEQLAQETEAIGRLQLDSRPAVPSSLREVGRLAAAMEEMKAGLRSFQKYVPADLVRSLLASGQEARLGGERRVVTIYFADFADFTTIAEKLEPEKLVELLGANLALLSEQMQEFGGTVDKFMGDSILAFWGAPKPNPRHALEACRAALRGRQRLQALHRQGEHEGKPALFTRFGIHTGEVIVGNIGSEARLNYTVIGNAVNLASRLEGLNKFYGTEILISESTFLAARPQVVARPLNWVAVKGKSEAVLVYELLGLSGETERACEEFAALCGQALTSYSRQEWSKALALFEQALRIRPTDRAAQMIIARCKAYQEKPPGEDWDKAHRIDAK